MRVPVRSWLGVASAATVIGAMLALPSARHPPTARPATPAPAMTPSRSAPPTGPTLATVWPHAKPFDIPAFLPDGSTYTPMAVLDPTRSLGTARSADGDRTGLVEVTGRTTARPLEWDPSADALTIDALTSTTTDVYWMRTVTDNDGNAATSLWRAGLTGGAAIRVTTDVGGAVFADSTYDLQTVGGRLYWMAAHGANGSELRSVATTGGPVTTRTLPGSWVLTAWPWLTTGPGPAGHHTQLYNVDTGRRRTVPAPTNQLLTCTPAWCRMIADNVADTSGIKLIRPDGTDLRQVGGADDNAVADDVALRDRFELLATAAPTSSPAIVIERLTLYDLTHRRLVVITPAAANAGARGDYIWWATGDNETLAWHALDLRALP
jgi:hypothetical protein